MAFKKQTFQHGFQERDSSLQLHLLNNERNDQICICLISLVLEIFMVSLLLFTQLVSIKIIRKTVLL